MSNMTTASQESLRRRFKAHIRYLKGWAGGQRLIMRNADFSGMDLRRLPFRDSVLIGCSFAHADLREADLSLASLLGCDFTGANLAGAIMTRADLRSANFNGAHLELADLTDALLSGGINVGASTSSGGMRHSLQTRFCNADLTGAKLTRAKLVGADMSGAQLIGAEMTETDLRRAVLRGADLTGAILNGVLSAEIDATGAKGAPDGFFEKRLIPLTQELLRMVTSHENWVTSNGEAGERATFDGTDLSSYDFSDALLPLASFRRCKLHDTSFNGASLLMADFSGAEMVATLFRKADLRGADFADLVSDDGDFTGARTGDVDYQEDEASSGEYAGEQAVGEDGEPVYQDDEFAELASTPHRRSTDQLYEDDMYEQVSDQEYVNPAPPRAA